MNSQEEFKENSYSELLASYFNSNNYLHTFDSHEFSHILESHDYLSILFD